MLQRLVVNVDGNTAARIASFAGVECASMNGSATWGAGTVAVVLRPRGGKPDGALGALEAVRDASARGVPVVVVAGNQDEAGKSILREARICGVPDACVLFVGGGKVVDAAGRLVADALRGTGIGINAVVGVAERAVRESLVPEMAVWDGAEAEEALWEAPEPETCETLVVSQREPGGTSPVVGAFFDAAERVVMVLGIKNGVGATTVAACLAGVLADVDPLHLEAAASPSGYLYYGSDPEAAANTGRYAALGGVAVGAPRACGVLIADVSAKEAVDAAYERADCVVVVTDGSPVAFERVGRWVRDGWRLDVLVVNRVVPGGYPPEVYIGEYGLTRVVGVPGSSEEELAVNLAQRKHGSPFGRSVDLDSAVADLGRAVRDVVSRPPLK